MLWSFAQCRQKLTPSVGTQWSLLTSLWYSPHPCKHRMFFINLHIFLYSNNLIQANEDCNCYTFDARKLDEAKVVHRDHVSAV